MSDMQAPEEIRMAIRQKPATRTGLTVWLVFLVPLVSFSLVSTVVPEWDETRYGALGIALIGLFLLVPKVYQLLSPQSAFNRFNQDFTETQAKVLRRRDDSVDTDYGGSLYSYYLVFEFEAGLKTVVLEAWVEQRMYDRHPPGSTLTVRYCTAEPRIALLEGEF
jgi:hypothetical protein